MNDKISSVINFFYFYFKPMTDYMYTKLACQCVSGRSSNHFFMPGLFATVLLSSFNDAYFSVSNGCLSTKMFLSSCNISICEKNIISAYVS